jgi:hypothetical protein
VFGIATTAQYPPAAAARVPVSMSSLCSWPGTRRWTCGSKKAAVAVDDLGAWRRLDAAGGVDPRDPPFADEHVVRGVEPGARVEDVGAPDEDVGRGRRRLDERAGGIEGAARAHAIDGSAVGAGAATLPASTS